MQLAIGTEFTYRGRAGRIVSLGGRTAVVEFAGPFGGREILRRETIAEAIAEADRRKALERDLRAVSVYRNEQIVEAFDRGYHDGAAGIKFPRERSKAYLDGYTLGVAKHRKDHERERLPIPESENFAARYQVGKGERSYHGNVLGGTE